MPAPLKRLAAALPLSARPVEDRTMTTSLWRRLTVAPRGTSHKARLGLEPLEAREVPAAIVGLTTANQLISIPSDSPAQSSGSSPTAINGLAAGERVVGIDF